MKCQCCLKEVGVDIWGSPEWWACVFCHGPICVYCYVKHTADKHPKGK